MRRSAGVALSKRAADDERNRLLRKLSRRRFERFRFSGGDALVARLREGEPVTSIIQAMLERPPMRIYPFDGGYIYKWSYNAEGGCVDGAEVEAKGWDHEHCDACNRNIEIGGTAWLTARSPRYALCPYCYRRVRQLGQA